MSNTNAQQTAQEAQSQAIDTLYKKDNNIVLENSGAEVKINRVKVSDLGKILALANTFIEELGLDANGTVTLDLQDSATLLRLISRLPNEVAEICGMLSSLSREEIQDLEADDGLQVLAAVIEVNMSFFSQKIKPKLDAVLKASGMSTLKTLSPA